jgi:hypothetical protein
MASHIFTPEVEKCLDLVAPLDIGSDIDHHFL